jgi:hypothetical protein
VPEIQFSDPCQIDKLITEITKLIPGGFSTSTSSKDTPLRVIGFAQAKLDKLNGIQSKLLESQKSEEKKAHASDLKLIHAKHYSERKDLLIKK